MHARDVLRQTSPNTFVILNPASTFILHHGWAAATTRHYAAAVNRYFLFMKHTKAYTFPTTPDAIYAFICWCTSNEDIKTVLSNTTKRYLTGLRMWHVLHDQPFPDVNAHRVRLLLKAALVTQNTDVPTRAGFTLMDIHRLVKDLNPDKTGDIVLKSLLLVGFWGLARLGELTYSTDHPTIFIRKKDVQFNSEGTRAHIVLRLAKTAQPGEVQRILLERQPNELDPISALQAVLRLAGKPGSPLFPSDNPTIPFKRTSVIAYLNTFKPKRGESWSGHSLRIGGASLRAHYGGSITALKRVGQWKSSSYKLYIRPYSKKTAVDTRKLARLLRTKT